MKFLEPWYAVTNSSALESQLRSELPHGHVLQDVSVTAIAQRQDCDDILFTISDGTNRVAVVHLTYSQNIDSRWPLTQFYVSISAWESESMLLDHAEFNA